MILTTPTKQTYTTTKHNHNVYIFTLYLFMLLCVVGNCLLFYCSCTGNCENCCGINGSIKDKIESEFGNKDNTIQIIFCGYNNTGKTSIITKYCKNTFNKKYESTNMRIGYFTQYYSFQISNNGQGIALQNLNKSYNIKLQLLDTGDIKEDRDLILKFLGNIHYFVYVYDVTNEKSFNNIDDSINGINIPGVLVANKIDLQDKRVVNIENGKKKAENLGLYYFECSALTGDGVNVIFETVIRKVLLSKLWKWGVNKEEMGKITIDIKKTRYKKTMSEDIEYFS